MKYKSFITYIGGKVNMMRLVNELIERRGVIAHNFVDLFGGGANSIFNVDTRRFKQFIYNDLDDNIYNLVKVIATKPDELKAALLLTPYSRREFLECKKGLNEEGITDVEKARRRFVCTYQSILNKGTEFRISHNKLCRNVYVNKINNIEELALTACNWILENNTWENVYNVFNNNDSLLFIDPPYMKEHCSGEYYKNGSSDSLHINLVETLKTTKAKFILCGYHNELYEQLLANGVNKICVDKKPIGASFNKPNSKTIRKECFWYNF